MPVVARPFPAALPHGELREVLPDLFFVTGTCPLPGPLPIRFSRNMTVIREGERLVLVNTVRLDERGLASLDRLGRVTDIIRIAGNHGMDDPFYAKRYDARVWALEGHRYTAGFDAKSPDTYFDPHVEVTATTELPIAGARVHILRSSPAEGLLFLPQHGGVLVAGDALQNWGSTDAYFNWVARLMMPRMGFIRAHNVGPAWLKQCKPPREDLKAILDIPFANVLPSHGAPVTGDARSAYRPVLERVSAAVQAA
jgi:hypothetical protein